MRYTYICLECKREKDEQHGAYEEPYIKCEVCDTRMQRKPSNFTFWGNFPK